jgi:hypothetical protein
MRIAQNGKARKMDLKRLRDLYSQYQQAERMFQQFNAFCKGAYGQKAVDSLLTANTQQYNETKMSRLEKEGLSANQIILDIINKIEKPIFSSKEIIQRCDESGHHYNVGTIYRVLNKLGRDEKLNKIRVSRGGKRAVDWKKINIQPQLIP